MTLGVGLIGYGLAGASFHAPLIGAEPRLALRAVATSQAEAVARDWPGVRATTAEAVIADSAIDLVVVASPNATHFDYAMAALGAGKHVVVDKPVATRVADADALVAAAARAQRMLVPFHNRRWDSDFLTVRRLLAAGTLGMPMLYEARWDRFRLAARGGWKEVPGDDTGLLIDLGSHLIDQALLLFGSPDAIDADIVAQRPEVGVDDYFELTLHYGAMRAILSASTLVAAARPRFAAHGTAGSFVKPGLDVQEAQLRAGMRPGDPGYGIEPEAIRGVLTQADGTALAIASEPGDYRRFYAGVAAAVADAGEPPVAARDAVAGLRVIEAARESARSGRRIAFGP